MATVGRVCVLPDDIEQSIITKHVYRITVDRNRIVPIYLMFSLMGDPLLIEEMREQVRGQTRPGINGQILKSLTVRLPPLKEQIKVCQRVASLLCLAEKIESRLQAATARIEKITQSILAKAFRGELVPTEAELARQEGRDYEPASVLLDRIGAQRSAQSNGAPTLRRAPGGRGSRRAVPKPDELESAGTTRGRTKHTRNKKPSTNGAP